jgi:palmitoyltransferase
MVVFAGVPFALLAGYGLQYVAQRVAEYAPSDMRQLYKTVSYVIILL